MIWSVEGIVGQSLLSSLSKVNYIVASPKAGAFAGAMIQESSGAAQLAAGLLWIVDHLGMCSLEKGGSEGTEGLVFGKREWICSAYSPRGEEWNQLGHWFSNFAEEL